MVPKMGFDKIDQPQIGLKNFALSITEPRFRIFHGFLHNPLGFTISPVLRHNQAFGRSYRPELFNDAVVDLLAQSAKKERFMMAVHSCVLHAPGDRNYPWSRMYDQQGYTGKNRFRYSRSGTALIAKSMSDGDSEIDITKQDHNIYDSGMQMADAMIKDIVDELKRSGLWDNTIIVLLSDHGEEMYAEDLPYKYHGPNHGYHPYGDGQHHVMLGIRFPDGAHKGKTIEDTVRLVDLAPTIADHFSLDWDNEFDGRSLLPLINGEEEEEERLVYIETGVSEKGYWQRGHRKYPFPSLSARYGVHESGSLHVKKEFMEHIVQGKDRAVQLGRWKLVWRPTISSGIVELYDRKADPLNRYNLAKQNPRIVAHLGLKMLPFLEADGEKNTLFKRWEVISERNETPDLYE
jgi:arylsulfatase A-like enzyme